MLSQIAKVLLTSIRYTKSTNSATCEESLMAQWQSASLVAVGNFRNLHPHVPVGTNRDDAVRSSILCKGNSDSFLGFCPPFSLHALLFTSGLRFRLHCHYLFLFYSASQIFHSEISCYCSLSSNRALDFRDSKVYVHLQTIFKSSDWNGPPTSAFVSLSSMIVQ